MKEMTIETFNRWLLDKSKTSKSTAQQYAKLVKTTEDFDLSTSYETVFSILSKKINTTVSKAAHLSFIKYLKDTTFDYDTKIRANILITELQDMRIRKKNKMLTVSELKYKVMTKQEVSQLYLATHNKSLSEIDRLQNLLLLRILYESAGRAEEVRRYTWDMIDIRKKTIEVPKSITKRNKYRMAEFSPKTVPILCRYKELLIQNNIKESRLFFNYKDYQSVYYYIRKLSKKTIGKEVTPHWFRHSFGTHKVVDALSARPPIERAVIKEEVQHYLNHEDVKTTEIYIKLADLFKRERIMEKYGEVP